MYVVLFNFCPQYSLVLYYVHFLIFTAVVWCTLSDRTDCTAHLAPPSAAQHRCVLTCDKTWYVVTRMLIAPKGVSYLGEHVCQM